MRLDTLIKKVAFFFLAVIFVGCVIKHNSKTKEIPVKETWVFIMAGQSNMAGRGLIEPQDTITNENILTINAMGDIITAKEPIHFYEPSMAGLDCGMSFAKTILANTSQNIDILLIPTAVGGSSIRQWLADENHRNVNLLSNFKGKVQIGKKYGEIKGILWHQGESDSNTEGIANHKANLALLFSEFRSILSNPTLPIIIGELGSYSNNDKNWQAINTEINSYAATDTYSRVISTSDLKHKGDKVHFNASGQRMMGKRFAYEFLDLNKTILKK